jgi:hypothetical protein
MPNSNIQQYNPNSTEPSIEPTYTLKGKFEYFDHSEYVNGVLVTSKLPKVTEIQYFEISIALNPDYTDRAGVLNNDELLKYVSESDRAEVQGKLNNYEPVRLIKSYEPDSKIPNNFKVSHKLQIGEGTYNLETNTEQKISSERLANQIVNGAAFSNLPMYIESSRFTGKFIDETGKELFTTIEGTNQITTFSALQRAANFGILNNSLEVNYESINIGAGANNDNKTAENLYSIALGFGGVENEGKTQTDAVVAAQTKSAQTVSTNIEINNNKYSTLSDHPIYNEATDIAKIIIEDHLNTNDANNTAVANTNLEIPNEYGFEAKGGSKLTEEQKAAIEAANLEKMIEALSKTPAATEGQTVGDNGGQSKFTNEQVLEIGIKTYPATDNNNEITFPSYDDYSKDNNSIIEFLDSKGMKLKEFQNAVCHKASKEAAGYNCYNDLESMAYASVLANLVVSGLEGVEVSDCDGSKLPKPCEKGVEQKKDNSLGTFRAN